MAEGAAWLGVGAPVNCVTGRFLQAVLATHLVEGLAIVCVVVWGLILFTWHIAPVIALMLLVGLSLANTQLPALLGAC